MATKRYTCMCVPADAPAYKVVIADNNDALRAEIGGPFECYAHKFLGLDGVGKIYVYINPDAESDGLPRNPHLPEFCGKVIIEGIDAKGYGRSLTDDECALLFGRFNP